MTKLHELQEGDQCWRINSIGSTAFLCKVIEVSRLSICVTDIEQTATSVGVFWFDKSTGRAAGRTDSDPAPTLVAYDDPIIASLRARHVLDGPARKHRQYRHRINELCAKLPGSKEDWDAIYDLLEEWEDWTEASEATDVQVAG